MKQKGLAGNFLIASPGMDDPNFGHSVVLICDHTEQGAFGLVVNRVLMHSLRSILFSFDIEKSAVDMPVYFGGPVKPEQGYIIYSPFSRRYGSIRLPENIGVTASKVLLDDIISGRGPEKYMFALGFSGWSSNQLEEELMTDSWLVAPMNRDLIFSVNSADRWRSAARLIGVDFGHYCGRHGNA